MHTAPTSRTQVKRIPQNASYDPALLHAIVDAAYVCHIAFTDAGGAHCIPTACWRGGTHLYIHGSNGSRLLKRLAEQDCCVTITHVDGLVLARSAFHHSMNYRSAMIYGRFVTVAEDGAKRAAMEAFMAHLAPGRQGDVRPGSDKEYASRFRKRRARCAAAGRRTRKTTWPFQPGPACCRWRRCAERRNRTRAARWRRPITSAIGADAYFFMIFSSVCST
jgi:nitroimidazol reductase NimA-like FMN-containing flavoprotein (pyridoxamine 5'-phosphate oxidase superfamily)